MKVLVTGAGGYIGRHVVKKLLDQNHTVIASDIRLDGVDPRAVVCNVPIFSDDPDIYDQLGRPDVCIHLAWKDGFAHNSPAHMDNLSSHIVFCNHMMAAGLPALGVMGTMHEVGYWEGAIDENTPCVPLSQYGIAKNAMRQSLLLSAKQYDCRMCWMRAYYITGDDMRGNSIFSKITQASLKGQKEFPFTSGKNRYDFVDVNELAKMIVAASLSPDGVGVVNVCTGHPISLGERVESFIRENHYEIRLQYGAFPDRPYDSPGVWGDTTKIQQILRGTSFEA